MTDTTVAAPGPAPSAPAPASQTEVPINPNPPSSPTPVGPQAPQTPVRDLKGSEHRPPSRREALQAAFDRATRMQDGKSSRANEANTAKKADAAVAKPGHNRPPEPTAEEKPKLNLKKAPEDQDAKTLEAPPRGERGRFARRTPELDHQGEVRRGQFDAQAGVQIDGKPTAPIRTLPDNAPFRDPPQRLAEHARADWHATPESVRGEVNRMHVEFAKAYNFFKENHEAFKPVARFHKMAQEHGTTLEQALVNYTSMEQKLRADVIGGLDVIVNNLGLKAANGAKLGLRDIAYHVLQQTPEQLRLVQQSNAQQAQTSQIGALHQEIAGLKSTLQQWQTAQQFTYTRSQVDQFADRHPRFDELGALIENELKLGFDLETAYRRAELLQPATQAPQTRTPAAQTRTADKSISGSPGTDGSRPPPRRPEKPTGRREAIANAIKRVNGIA